jgi:hypothetical protein
MHKFPINNYRIFGELPLDKFDSFKFSVYIIDFEWNYLFVNDFVRQNLGPRAQDIIGKNMWKEFPELEKDPVFGQLREKMDSRIPCTVETTSPVNGKRLYITGYPLEDCFYFTSSILPDKQELMNELRSMLGKKKE